MRKIVVCIGISLAAMLPRAYATNGMRVIGVGPIQRSMAGAGVALPLDSATALTNPAALIALDRRFDAASTYLNCEVQYRATSTGSMVTRNGASLTSATDACFIPALGLVWPMSDTTTLGCGAYGISGMGVDYAANLYHNVTYTEYQLMRLSPAVGHQVKNDFAIGAALNLEYAAMEFNAGSPLEQPHNDGDALGVGMTVAVWYFATDQVSWGMAYETKRSFTDYTFRTPGGTDKLHMDQPQNLTLGLAWRPTAPWRVAFDVTWIDWSQTLGKNQPAYVQNSTGATAWNMDWDAQWIYKWGLEYDLNESTTLRVGYNYGKHPLHAQQAFEAIAFPAIAEQHVTAGMSVQLSETYSLHMAGMFSPKVTFAAANGDQFIDHVSTEMSQYSVDVGWTYHF